MIIQFTTLEPARVDLLPQFVEHYRNLGVERFLLSLHIDPTMDAAQAAAEKARFEATLARLGIDEAYYFEGTFDAVPFYNHQADMQARFAAPDDWVVWADSDEFQLYPAPLASIVAQLEKHDVHYMGGVFVDRVAADGSLPPFDPARSVWEQFPVACLVTKDLAKGDTKKVVLARGWVQISHGSHVPSIERPLHSAALRIPREKYPQLRTAYGRVQVHHFKWDASVIERLRQRVTPEWKAKHSYWIESQRLLDYFEANGMKFDFADLTIVEIEGGKLLH